MIFETHAHYDDEAFDPDRESLLEELQKGGIGRVVNIGASLKSCRSTLALMEKYPFVYGALGVHPSETAELSEEGILWLKEHCAHKKCVAVGEIGLDYHWPEPEKEVQKKWFIRQLELAKELNLPVVIHSREAAKDTVDIMKELNAGETGGIIHCFSYTKETAEIFLDMGFYFGIGGVVTFKNAKQACGGNGQPVSGPGAKQGKTKQFIKSSIYYRRNCRDQKNFPRGSGGRHVGKRKKNI